MLSAKADIDHTPLSGFNETIVQKMGHGGTRAFRACVDLYFDSFGRKGTSASNERQHRAKMERLPVIMTSNPL